MSAPTIRRRRKATAREAAEKFGVSIRTIKRLVSEERSDYENRAADRRRIAGEMHAKGESWAAIAAAVDGTEWAARGLVHRWRIEQQENAK